MFETEAGFAETKMLIKCNGDYSKKQDYQKGWQDGAEFGYNLAKEEIDYLNKHWGNGKDKANEWHSPNEHINKDRVVLGYIKLCNKKRYSLVQWNGEWWYQYGSFNAEVRLIAWCDIPELPKESE